MVARMNQVIDTGPGEARPATTTYRQAAITRWQSTTRGPPNGLPSCVAGGQSSHEEDAMSRRGWALFLALGIIWGTPYLLIKVAVEDLPPASLVLARTSLATLLLLPLAAARGLLRPLLPHWRPLVVYTLVEICAPWVLLGYAEQHLSSSLTGLLVAAVPLVGAVLVKVTGHEPMASRRVLGLLVGFAGVALLVGFDVGASSPGPVAALVLGALVLDGRIPLATAAGFALILFGSVLATQREPARERAEPVPVGARGIDDVAGEDVAACPVAEP